MAVGGYGFVDADFVAVSGGVLLQQDGVSALRNNAAGEDSNGLAWSDGPRKRMAGRESTSRYHGGNDMGDGVSGMLLGVMEMGSSIIIGSVLTAYPTF